MKRFLEFFAFLLAGAMLVSCDDSTSAGNSDGSVSAKVDTVFVRDTIRVADTLETRDTVEVNVRDTLNVRDTVKVRDTLNVYDTLSVKDTVNTRDTLMVHDTLKVADTLNIHDTIVKYSDSCSVKNNEDGSVVLTCGENVQTLYASLCGGVPYDAETKICVDGVTKDRCGDQPYDKDKEFCVGGRVYGSLMDTRDGKVYRTITIGEQTWMAENLNYASGYNVCGGGKEKSTDPKTGNCAVYGRLYKWASAMALEPKYDFTLATSVINSPHRGICPQGWHIPTSAEWQTLYRTVIAERPAIPFDVQMRSDSLWRFSEEDGGDGTVEQGQNSSGFNVLPAGRTWMNSEGVVYNDEGRLAHFVSATEFGTSYSSSGGSFENTTFYNHNMNGLSYLVSNISDGLMKVVYTSVRCVMDSPADE